MKLCYWTVKVIGHITSRNQAVMVKQVTQFTQPQSTAVKPNASKPAKMEPNRDERFSSENVNSISNI
jgi:hypothetical protein